jgi:hypothetical protein
MGGTGQGGSSGFDEGAGHGGRMLDAGTSGK